MTFTLMVSSSSHQDTPGGIFIFASMLLHLYSLAIDTQSIRKIAIATKPSKTKLQVGHKIFIESNPGKPQS